jgi:L-threonylcarbamoyladenylate synthase
MRRLDARLLTESEIHAACTAALSAGQVVVFPTDTVYGIACRPDMLDAVARIYRLKERPAEKPLSLLLSTVDELLAYGAVRDPLRIAAARRFLPGGLTMIVERPIMLDAAVTAGRATVGLRVPDSPWLQRLLTLTGPLASTSANFSGQAAYDGAERVELPQVDLCIDAGPTQFRRESSVIDFTDRTPTMLREGILSREAFTTWLHSADYGMKTS